MKKSTVLLVLAAFLSAAAGVSAVSWTTNSEEALAKAGRTGKTVFVYVYRRDSMDCKMVSEESFKDQAIVPLIEKKTVPVRTDIDKDTWPVSLIARIGTYKVTYPLIVLMNSDGSVLDYHQGYIAAADLVNFLIKNLTAGSAAGKMTTEEPATFEKAFAAYEDQNWFIAAGLFNRLDDAKLSAEQKLKKHFSLGVLYYINKDYAKAVDEYMLAYSVKPEANTLYNLTCAYSLENDLSAAVFYLQKAVDAGFSDTEALKTDADLAGLRGTKEFSAILKSLSGKPAVTVKTPKPAVVPQPVSGSYTEMEKKCFDLVNAMRTEKGLKPLVWADDLMAVARKHSEDMGTRNFFDHTNPDGLDPFQRMENGGVNFSMAAENIAYNSGYGDPASVAADGWKRSSGHYHNIMTAEYEESAIGMARTPDGRYYFTQVFIKRR